jgi:tetratricopeptide (TPR) repeat protein
LYRAAGQTESARALYESPSAPSDEPELWLALADLSLQEKDEARLSLATEHLVALAQRQHETEALYRLARLHLDADDPRGALAVTTEALHLSPGDPESFYWMGRSYAALREWPRAQEQLERARAGLPERAELYYWLAQTYAAQGDAARAKENFQTTLNTTRDERLRRLAEEALGRL